MSSYAIAAQVDRGQGTVRHWLRAYGLKTRTAGTRSPRPQEDVVERLCAHHGVTAFVRYGSKDHHRCEACRKERVTRRRRVVKQLLVADAGGRCSRCGYDRCAAALHFHHVDPSTKSFGIALHGNARSLARARAEAAKCVLLCANCHAEVEHGGLSAVA